ncbi:DUF6443 domain-containing protein [Chryseobacterium sp. T16E-39]|uniref:DUF6443 domain-containing protein n=1 Tax=Chryseobacterium sp. T16E-39 TaxID=2015076 RepID=UPI0012FC5789|nr:DUF6443 domain-containing protein [Chryseobacterium sp. T16E-39]
MMKRILTLMSLWSAAGFTYAQTLPASENYIQSRTYLDSVQASSTSARQINTVQYFDGLGRPKQVVNVKASPLGRDLVTPIQYDGFGRQTRDYLPVPQLSTNGGVLYTQTPNVSDFPVGDPAGIYPGERAFSEKTLENSPLDKILDQKQVGIAWAAKPVVFGYLINTATDVRRYTTITTPVENRTDYKLTVAPNDTNTANGYYKANQLYRNSVKDEDGNETIEFKNGKGQVVLVRKVINATDNADTYYVYNEYGQLAFVIPPKASFSIKGLVAGTTITGAVLTDLCYQYRYDGKNRLVEKKLPGKGWEFMVYNKADQLVMTKDVKLAGKNQWLFTKYDQFGRVVYTGLINNPGSRLSLQNAVDTNANIYETRSTTAFTLNGMPVYYSTVASPVSNVAQILSINYYDTYPPGTPAAPNTFGQKLLTDNPGGKVTTKGLPTASYVKNIEDDNWTKNYNYYDKKGRVTGTYSINHLGGYTQTETEFDFAGAAKRSNTTHLRKQGEIAVLVKERFVYDAQNRLKQHYHQVDNNPEELLTDNTYNELSQLSTKKVGNNLQSIDYAYNIRGWMTDINKNQMSVADLGGKLFAYKIKYNQKEGITNPDSVLFSGKNVEAKYNGNIAEVDWRSVETIGANPSLTPKRYGYVYDALNRLTAGYYQNPNNPTSKENTESLAYDLNGNITTLYRTSVMQGTIATKIDDLVYTYAGNQATTIKDNSANKTGYEGIAGLPITYDLNGNMETMADKSISGIVYNYLNLPNKLTIDKGTQVAEISTKYSSDGTKLRKENYTSFTGVAGTTWSKIITDYLDGFQYLNQTSSEGSGGSTELMTDNLETSRALEMEAYSPEPVNNKNVLSSKNPELQFFPTAEGFYDYTKDQYIYQYKDHLGNVRISFARNSAGALEITDSNDYYPFGMNHLKTGNSFFSPSAYMNYKYNGKELQETGMYDYGARMYMADIGRWGVVDLLAEKYQPFSGYNYVLGNPISNVDPDGMEVKHDFQILKNGEVKLIKETESKSDTLYASNDKGEVDKSKGSVTVKKAEKEDATIISNLATNRKDEFGFKGPDLRIAITNNRTDALDVFQFAALNSTNEWSIQSNTINGKNEYALGTQLDPAASPNYLAIDKLGYSLKNTLNWDMHSHGSPFGTNGPSSGDISHYTTKTATRFLFRTNGSGRGQVYPYGKTNATSSLFKQRNFGDMDRKFSNYSDFK